MGKGDGKVTEGDIKREVGASNLEVSNLRGGRNFPIRYGKVTRVDPKRMVVDLVLISQTNVDFSNVPISFPGAGARHFFGAMPEVGDICLIGQQPAESGRSKRPVILGWYVPSTQAGYDWLNVRSHGPDELDLTPKQKVALDGIASERLPVQSAICCPTKSTSAFGHPRQCGNGLIALECNDGVLPREEWIVPYVWTVSSNDERNAWLEHRRPGGQVQHCHMLPATRHCMMLLYFIPPADRRVLLFYPCTQSPEGTNS